MNCLSENAILSYAEGRLGREELALVDGHVAGCERCQRLLAAAFDLEGLRSNAAPTGAAPPPRDEQSELARGTVIGRYTVLYLAGRGGMGEVYAAFDEELNRKVALKLLRVRDGGSNERSRARLLREARVMARLSHPNAVSVHDVGTFDAGVFVAMEFIEGSTLDAWLAAGKRTRTEILEVFVAAARGLGTAHAAGLVHRDFKPQNLMIGRDGVVRVMDFGLARTVGDPDNDLSDAPAGAADHTRREIDLTRTGEMLGTPAYMAPEQFLAGATDARTDQFSFCVTLCEALYGQRPFAGEKLKDLMAATATGSVREPPPGSRVQNWMRRALLRGLAPDPANRFPSMDALVDALTTDPNIQLRRAGFVVTAILFVGGAAFGAQRISETRSSVCHHGADRLADVWEPPGISSVRKNRIRAAFAATGKSYARQAYDGAARLLDEYVQKWLGSYRDTCEATHIRGEQSTEVLDLRMTCLQEHLTSLRALTDVMTAADGKTVDNAVAAAGGLPDLDRCADVALLKTVVQPPPDVATRTRVARLRAEVAHLAALRDSGHCSEARTLATDLLERVRRTAYLPLLAQTLTNAGLLCNECESLGQALIWLREGYVVAVEAHDDETAATAATLVSGFSSIRGHLREEARLWLSIGRASLARIEPRPLLESWWLVSEGNVLLDEGRPSEAVTAFQKSIELKKRVLGENNVDVLRSVDNLAAGLEAAGKVDESLATFAANTKAAERILGPEHELVGKLLSNEGESLNLLGRPEEARAAFMRSVAILEHNGTPPEFVAYPLTGLGLAYVGAGRPTEAIVPLERALKARVESSMSPELVGEARFGLARALWSRQSQRGRAVELAQAARADYARVPTARKQTDEIETWLADRSTKVRQSEDP